jgi:uncharacterized protein YxeA
MDKKILYGIIAVLVIIIVILVVTPSNKNIGGEAFRTKTKEVKIDAELLSKAFDGKSEISIREFNKELSKQGLLFHSLDYNSEYCSSLLITDLDGNPASIMQDSSNTYTCDCSGDEGSCFGGGNLGGGANPCPTAEDTCSSTCYVVANIGGGTYHIRQDTMYIA